MRLNELDRYNEGPKEMVPVETRNVPLSVKLKDKIQYHQDQITKLNATLVLLEKNQDIEKLLFMLNEIH